MIHWIICEAADDEVANTSVIRDTDKSNEKAAKNFYVISVTLQVIERFTWQGSTTKSSKKMETIRLT